VDGSGTLYLIPYENFRSVWHCCQDLLNADV
jgi:hypothetical protein